MVTLPWDSPLSSAHHLLKWATTAELPPPLATLYEGHSLTNPPGKNSAADAEPNEQSVDCLGAD